MQLAFSTLILLFLLLPGIAFRLGYLKRDGLQILTETKLYIEILFVVFLSFALHFILWGILEYVYFDFKIDLFFDILTGQKGVLEDKETLIYNFIAYNAVLSLLIFIVGWRLNKYFDKIEYEFPENFQFLDYTGYWDRIFADNKDIINREFNVLVDILIEINNECFIYTGVLKRYYIDSKGYLDKLILEKVIRITLEDYNALVERKNKEEKKIKDDLDKSLSKIDSENKINDEVKDEKKNKLKKNLLETFAKTDYDEYEEDEFIEIPSHHFVVYGSTIKNVGIRYENHRTSIN